MKLCSSDARSEGRFARSLMEKVKKWEGAVEKLVKYET